MAMDDFCFCNVNELIFTCVNGQPWKLKYCCSVWFVPLIKNTVACCVRDLSQPHLFYQFMSIRWKKAAKCDICGVVSLKRYETCILNFWCLTHYMCMIIVVNYSPCSQNINYIDNVLLATLFQRVDKMHNTYTIVHMNITRVFCKSLSCNLLHLFY